MFHLSCDTFSSKLIVGFVLLPLPRQILRRCGAAQDVGLPPHRRPESKRSKFNREVALGSGGARHPLEPAHLPPYLEGEVWVRKNFALFSLVCTLMSMGA